MGYSTTLYAVDLGVLKSAIGSKSASLRKLFEKSEQARAARTKREHRGPRVKLTRKSEIILNGQRVSWSEFVREMRRPKWRGTYIYKFLEGGRTTGRFAKGGSFPTAMGKALVGTRFLGEFCVSREEDLRGEDDELSVEQAALDLIEGTISRPEAAGQYGNALERLCDKLGTRLATIEGKGGILDHLGLDTRLCKERSPVRLPKTDGYPSISYLTAKEVEGELKWLSGLELSYQYSAEIDEDRRTFLKCLQKAAKKRVGVVAFYY